MSSSRVVSFDFHNNHRVRRRRRRKGRGTPAGARKSPLGHGAAADDAARCVGGLTAIRSASTKAPLVQRALQYFNHEFFLIILLRTFFRGEGESFFEKLLIFLIVT